ncbi:MAG: insulinase family protein [Anaerolineaceae bacterium]|nr:insulinase family protein [Anaerolineaceae bacterium]
MNETFSAHILDNGLIVLLQENHSVPLISHRIWYRVGSRNEVPGKTGISHFVEHMLFRGTERFPGQEALHAINRCGGSWNAVTSLDWTSFFATIPSNRIGILRDIEADRMVNSLFTPEDICCERKVILSEKERNAGGYASRLTASMKKAAFPHHPYRRELIGETEDLLSLTRDDIYEYYRTWYTPNNAVITMAGDFDTDEILRSIEAAYGDIPCRSLPDLEIAPAGPITGPVRIEDHGSCGQLYMTMTWRVPGANDPDIPGLLLLAGILVGPTAECCYDEKTATSRTSRLFRKLVRGGMTTGLSAEYTPTLDPYIFNLCMTLSPGILPEAVSEAVFSELEDIAQRGVPPAEINKAIRKEQNILACFAEDISCQTYFRGYSSMIADPSWHSRCMEQMENITPEDISRTAGTLFRRDNCIISVYRKEEE